MTDIGESAFSNCSSLTNVTIPRSVTEIKSGTFYYCSGLTNITIPDSVTSIGLWAFTNCSNLANVTIGSGLTSIGQHAFQDCSSLQQFNVSSDNANYKSVDGMLLTKDGTTLVAGVNGNATIPNGVINIEDYAFSNRSNLVGVSIPDSVTSIGKGAF